MSRRRPADNSTAVSLFPFLAVLLCTMGALLVVLVAVSRAAREAALREDARIRQQPPVAEEDPEIRRELEQIGQFQNNLQKLRAEAEQRLREDQLRLGQLEEHMRRLQDQLALLQAAAFEIEALEEEHYDDREQAEREISRLEKLIEETHKSVEELRERVKSQKRSYALIPYEGPNGTLRRPLYIECRKNELLLQPEGVRVKREDLLPPYGAGNPLAAALRAARDYYVRLNPTEGQSRDTEPYPLLVVRPEGLMMYNVARRAIQGADLEFGFELVEDDWTLNYPAADPHLATIEQQAIDQARIRQKALAAAAPRAYRQPALVAAGRFDDDGSGDFYGDGDDHFDDGGGYGGSDAQGVSGQSGAASASDRYYAGDAPTTVSSMQHDAQTANGPNAQPSGSQTQSGDNPDATAVATGQSGAASGDSASQPGAGTQVNVSTGSNSQQSAGEHQFDMETARGRDWALDRKKPNTVPIRRSIQVLVRADHIAILADNAQASSPSPTGRRIEFKRDTVESIDEIVAVVRDQIDGWGFAGDGMYWRPVLNLHVAPEAERRADDLNRLLKDSGLEIKRSNSTTK